MTIKIRAVERKDKSALINILNDIPEFKPFEIEVAVEVIDDCLHDDRNSGYFVLIAEENTEVAGYICYGPTPLTEGTWDIYWEVVAPKKQGRGIGSALMKAAEKEIKEANGRLSLIETSSTPVYEKTRSFYLSLGYEIIARIPDYYSPGDDKTILQKRLR
jgi:ribosomal protein S18 acetylase RimI-like enzyme